MQFEIHRTEDNLINLYEKGEVNDSKDILKHYIKKDNLVKKFADGRFDENHYINLSSKINKTIKRYSKLISEVKKVSEDIKFDKEFINRKLVNLAEIVEYEKDFYFVTFISGFDSAASQYSNCIFFGIEWFVDPEVIDLKESNPIFKHVDRLSSNPKEFIDNNLLHEFVHLVTNDINTKDEFLWHLIEEGRAVYISNLMEPQNTLIPLDEEVVKWSKKNERYLIENIRSAIDNEDSQEYAKFFSPGKDINGYSLTGYYLGYVLVKRYIEDVKDKETKIRKLSSLNSSKEIEKILFTYY